MVAGRGHRVKRRRTARSAVGDESSADEVFVESEEAVEAEFLHDGETGTVDPSDPALTIADKEVPRVAATLGRGFDHVAESSALNRLTSARASSTAPRALRSVRRRRDRRGAPQR